jgi:hypothetical protein
MKIANDPVVGDKKLIAFNPEQAGRSGGVRLLDAWLAICPRSIKEEHITVVNTEEEVRAEVTKAHQLYLSRHQGKQGLFGHITLG